jgi:hypothetical protein
MTIRSQELVFTSRVVDVVGEGFDLAVRAGPLGGLVARRAAGSFAALRALRRAELSAPPRPTENSGGSRRSQLRSVRRKERAGSLAARRTERRREDRSQRPGRGRRSSLCLHRGSCRSRHRTHSMVHGQARGSRVDSRSAAILGRARLSADRFADETVRPCTRRAPARLPRCRSWLDCRWYEVRIGR